MRNKSEKSKDKKRIISKENVTELMTYLGIIILIMIVFSVSYYAGSFFRNSKPDIPIGQEYRLKSITPGSNSTFTVIYYDNDKNHTEKIMLPTNYNKFNIIKSNNTVAILKLESSENGINYWNIYMQKKNQMIHK